MFKKLKKTLIFFAVVFFLFVIALYLFSNSEAVQKAKANANRNIMRQIDTACRRYYDDHHKAPSQIQDIREYFIRKDMSLISPYGDHYVIYCFTGNCQLYNFIHNSAPHGNNNIFSIYTTVFSTYAKGENCLQQEIEGFKAFLEEGYGRRKEGTKGKPNIPNIFRTN